MTEELLKKYIHYFGDTPPFPPKHIMESLVRMKDDGTFDAKLKAVSSIRGELKEKIETLLFTKRELRHIDFSLIKTTLRYLNAESIIEDSSIDTSINVVKDIIKHIENGNIDPLYNFSFSSTLFLICHGFRVLYYLFQTLDLKM